MSPVPEHPGNHGPVPGASCPAKFRGLQKVRTDIRRRRLHGILLAVLATAAVLLGVLFYYTTPVYLPAREAVQQVEADEDGFLEIRLLDRSLRISQTVTELPEDMGGGREQTIVAWHTRLDRELPELAELWKTDQGVAVDLKALEADNIRRIWYAGVGPGEEDVLIWGEPLSGGRVSLPRLVLSYYLLISLGLGAVLGILAAVLRKKKAGKALSVLAVFCGCFALGAWVVTGGNLITYHAGRIFLEILVLAFVSAAAIFQAVWVLQTHWQDRAAASGR